ncbi:hypothetical protein MUK42_10416 [Musa troglodytarum]|uniref:Uncharacterized protein n=1 Tax=Musa troglodytarum TaxID=320322 RepID=A0A9E7GYK4_9LILI|nr:hypothetical protein MUK42_10416 [Musa troglodytarum]
MPALCLQVDPYLPSTPPCEPPKPPPSHIPTHISLFSTPHPPFLLLLSAPKQLYAGSLGFSS